MLYLEDYMEMIENLPMEMRDRFTDMRELDLKVENAMDSIDDRVKAFFKKCQGCQNLKQEWKDEQFQKLKEDYERALEDADEKVQLANQIYEMVDRYLRKLDQELSKFKMELEADHAGITEILEKRSLELDAPPKPSNNHRGEKRKYAATSMNSHNHNHLDKRTSTEKVLSNLATEAARAAIAEGLPRSHSSPGLFNASSSSPALSYSLGHVGAGSNAAIAVAASRAIGATLEMSQGRRTSSLKASYAAVSQQAAGLNKDLNLGSTAAAPSPLPAEPTTKSSRNKKSSSRSQQQQQHSQPATPVPPPDLPTDDVLPSEGLGTDVGVDEMNPLGTWNVDPNEPRYCLCNDVSYGEMVGCDNEDCPIEWFHYGCVGLNQAPKGKWYCPQCTAAMKRRGRK